MHADGLDDRRARGRRGEPRTVRFNPRHRRGVQQRPGGPAVERHTKVRWAPHRRVRVRSGEVRRCV